MASRLPGLIVWALLLSAGQSAQAAQVEWAIALQPTRHDSPGASRPASGRLSVVEWLRVADTAIALPSLWRQAAGELV